MQRFKNIFNFHVMDVYMFRCALHLRKPCFQNNINLDFQATVQPVCGCQKDVISSMCPIMKDLSLLTQRLNDIVKNEMCMLSFYTLSICTIMEKLYTYECTESSIYQGLTQGFKDRRF